MSLHPITDLVTKQDNPDLTFYLLILPVFVLYIEWKNTGYTS